MERRNAWLSYTEAEEKELEQVAKAYRNFLNVGKTERECVTQIISSLLCNGIEQLPVFHYKTSSENFPYD